MAEKVKWVKWYHEWGLLVAHCPYCDELAYEKNRCVFCGKEYEYTQKPVPDLKAESKMLWAVMPSNDSIYVFDRLSNGLVRHESVCGKWDDKKLKRHLEELEKEVN